MTSINNNDNISNSEDSVKVVSGIIDENNTSSNSDLTYEWYVLQTYSGHEDKVRSTIEQVIKKKDLGKYVPRIEIPTQTVTEIKNSKKKTSVKKTYPGYIFIKMKMNSELWSIIRRARGVTNFVGSGSKPNPLSKREIDSMSLEDKSDKIEVKKNVIDIELNDSVNIISGPFDGSIGEVSSINYHKQSITVKLLVFGRETPVELDFSQVRKI
ncbi:MAG: transcription termination/antitermination protein NusG [Clostridiales bacterium]|jgi:transcriptional antiterminator NusG|nr:transcription termination/antitermination protein NusG [Clostridiales bacterium]